MTTVRIDYLMTGSITDDDEIVKTARDSITVPMMDHIAEDVLHRQTKSVYAAQDCRITKLVTALALVRGFEKARFLKAERVDT